MDLMNIRRNLLLSQPAYEAWNLTFDGTTNTVIDTGVYLFTTENINRNFEVIIENLYGKGNSNNTIICAKHNGNAYGFFIRCNGGTNTTYKGTISVKKQYNNNIIVRLINGVISVSGDTITNPKVQFTFFSMFATLSSRVNSSYSSIFSSSFIFSLAIFSTSHSFILAIFVF